MHYDDLLMCLRFLSTISAAVPFLALLAFNSKVIAADPTLETRAGEVAKLFALDPGPYEGVFAPSFLAAVPPEQLTPILLKTFQQVGHCIAINRLTRSNAFAGEFDFEFEKGFFSHATLNIDTVPPHLVTGFSVGPPVSAAKSIDDIIATLKMLPGSTSLFVGTIEPASLHPIAQLNPDQPLAVGSAFKLYVLAELIRQIDAGNHNWSDVIPLDEGARSFPSGFLQTWPSGAPITLHTLASLMISQSDNTAADQLARFLGRDKIEKMLSRAGMADPDRNIPFLTTLEMFKLKAQPGDKLIAGYLAANPTDRLKMLNTSVAQLSRDTFSPYAQPTHVSDVEWFVSTSDLARVMQWIGNSTTDSRSSAARGILAINPGLPAASARAWQFVGYKGGSEPGVLNLTYLLQAPDNHWVTVSATWNDPRNTLDDFRFIGLVQRAIQLAQQPMTSQPTAPSQN